LSSPEFDESVSGFLADPKRRKELRSIYNNRELGDANAISMSLYVGPTSHTLRKLIWSNFNRGPRRHACQTAWLLTGDSKLANRERRVRWQKFFKDFGSRVGTMMLPHHGAYANFHSAILDVAPTAALFVTADGDDALHPHEDVLCEVKACSPPRELRTVSTDGDDTLVEVSGDSSLLDSAVARVVGDAWC